MYKLNDEGDLERVPRRPRNAEALEFEGWRFISERDRWDVDDLDAVWLAVGLYHLVGVRSGGREEEDWLKRRAAEFCSTGGISLLAEGDAVPMTKGARRVAGAQITRLSRVYAFAAQRTAAAVGAGSSAETEASHAVMMAELVADATKGEADAVGAAILYATMRATGTSLGEIERTLGYAYSGLLNELTRMGFRPEALLERAGSASRFAKIIWLADLTATSATLADASEARRNAFLGWALPIVQRCHMASADLAAKFDAAAQGFAQTA